MLHGRHSIGHNVPRLMRSDGKRSEAEFDGISHRRCYLKCRGAKRSSTKENSDGGAARYPKWSGATFWITVGRLMKAALEAPHFHLPIQ